MKSKPSKKKKRTLIFDEAGLKAFAIQMKKVRGEVGMTQEDVAYSSGLTLSQIGRIETHVTNPTLSTIFKIARTLKVEVKELFDFKLPPEK